MVEPVTTGLAIAGIAGSLFGGKKDKSVPTSGFGVLPKAVQDAFLQTYLPGVLEQFSQPFQAVPMGRVSAPSSVFDSQALFDLQQYSDDIGGLFTPLNPQQGQAPTAPMQPVKNELPPEFTTALMQLMGPNFGNIGSTIGKKRGM